MLQPLVNHTVITCEAVSALSCMLYEKTWKLSKTLWRQKLDAWALRLERPEPRSSNQNGMSIHPVTRHSAAASDLCTLGQRESLAVESAECQTKASAPGWIQPLLLGATGLEQTTQLDKLVDERGWIMHGIVCQILEDMMQRNGYKSPMTIDWQAPWRLSRIYPFAANKIWYDSGSNAWMAPL